MVNTAKNFLIMLKQSVTDALKTDSKRAIQEKAETNGDLIGNRIADIITKVLKNSPQNVSETDYK